MPTSTIDNTNKPVVLICRSIGDRHELWGLTVGKDGARSFDFMGTVLRPESFSNRVVVS